MQVNNTNLQLAQLLLAAQLQPLEMNSPLTSILQAPNNGELLLKTRCLYAVCPPGRKTTSVPKLRRLLHKLLQSAGVPMGPHARILVDRLSCHTLCTSNRLHPGTQFSLLG